MFNHPPREKEWVSWLWVAIGSLVIFLTIPIARTLQEFVREHWGDETFLYGVGAVIILAAVAAILYSVRGLAPTSSFVWLTLISIIFIGYTIKLRAAPSEALHFLEYGVLSLLIYRALTHQVQDVSVSPQGSWTVV